MPGSSTTTTTVRSQLRVVAESAVSTLDSIMSQDDTQLNIAHELLVNAVVADASLIHVVGMGKSGIIAQKIAASFRSFGIRTTYIHAGEGIHGDIGVVNVFDVIIALTHSGNTQEVSRLIQALDSKLDGNYHLIVISSSADALADLEPNAVLTYQASELAGFAPSASCIAQLVYGDALLAGLIEELSISRDDFQLNHPGGNLGGLQTTDDV